MAFPTTSVLDNFNRANEGPPPSANWSGPIKTGHTQLRVVSNTVQPQSGATGDNDNWWNVGTFGPDVEVFCDMTSRGTTDTYYEMPARLSSPGTSTPDFYSVVAANTRNQTADRFWIYRVDDGSYTQLGSEVLQNWEATDAVGIECVGTTITAYWRNVSTWTAVANRTDSTYGGTATYIGCLLGTVGPPIGDNWGGGTVSTGATPKTFSGSSAMANAADSLARQRGLLYRATDNLNA